jgi:OmpA-OmpF porin, OOP family
MKQTLAAAIACLVLAAPALAQNAVPEMSEQEILERFEKQKTRGLSIAPIGDDGERAEAGAAIEPQIPEEEQVNVSIVFDFDSAALRSDQRPKLANLCSAMQEADVELFRVVGHTDAAGAAEYNERLSRLRAEEVVRYLVSDCGIAGERLEAVGMGERLLYDAENPRADVNRRVEFQVLG